MYRSTSKQLAVRARLLNFPPTTSSVGSVAALLQVSTPFSTSLVRSPRTSEFKNNNKNNQINNIFDLNNSHNHSHHNHVSVRALGIMDKKPATKSLPQFSFETLPQLIEGACRLFPHNEIFGFKPPGGAIGQYEFITYAQFRELYEKTRTLLAREFGVGVNDKVAIISNNRVEWASLMFGTVALGAQFVPMYEAQLEKDWRHIIQDSGAKLLVVSNRNILRKIAHYRGTVGNVQHVLCLEDCPAESTAEEALPTLPQLLRKTQEGLQSGEIHHAPGWSDLTPDHCALIIYTSGTTGMPKGAELSHGNVTSDVHGARAVLGDHLSTQRSLAFLPWAHVFGFTTELSALVSTGSALAIVPNRDELLQGFQSVKPTILLSVPMMFNTVYDGIMKNVAGQSPLKQKIFHHALRVARRRNVALEKGESVSPLTSLQHKIFDKVLFSKIREKLGGNLTYMAAGGAAVPPNVLEFFDDLDIPILEGYGLTETSPIITSSGLSPDKRRVGCVGIVLPGQEVRIVDPGTLDEVPSGTDGEIVVSGPNVMLGYRNNPQANEEVFFHRDYSGSGEAKRFFRTGDLGRFQEERFLRITGRIKEQFKLENGKYVVPAPVEDIFARGPLVQQCYLYGSNKAHTVMLIVPNYVEIYNYAKANGVQDVAELVPYKTIEEVRAMAREETNLRWEDSRELALFQNENFVHLITSELLRHSVQAKQFECPTLWMPVKVPFSVENQLLTPKLSLRRKNVLTAYQPLVEGMYAGTMGHRVHYKPRSSKNIEM